ncbi:MAG: extracellular solute-binding protein [Pseudomonadales bacterium]|nr:extracellular solute-binding protein [Pseudomonadales bacterium]MDP7597308.1 extracellular solute-binding protein [Pseudomonadales bacterium]HJN49799.1 extracellular solute-binding protein [Pseudomonadales bacterium]
MRFLATVILFCSPLVHAFDYSHGTSYIEPLKYDADFSHFEYVNPDAPKGGTLRAPDMGTFDSFNGILDKGRVVNGFARLGEGNLVYDRLLEPSIDEPASYYGRLATGIWVAEDFTQFAFKIREGARWHDGIPLTVEDVVHTFETLKENGAAGVKTALMELDTIEKISDNEVLFTTRPGARSNPDLVFVVGGYSILPKHYWATRDISKTTLLPPLGSGPYRAGKIELGRNIILERVDDYWGAEIPVNRGRYNFDRVKYDYFRDESVQLEAIKGDVIDIRNETVSKNWTVAYSFPAVQAGYFKKELVDLARPWGLWGPIMWNLDRKRFQDIRVREALWLLSEFRLTNRILMHGFYNYAKSYFYNSPMASSGLPSKEELALLEPLRGRIPDRVFSEPWLGNETSGYGYDREHLKRSLQLFKEAGWQVRDGVMVNVETGQPFRISFIFISPFSLRQETPFMRMLNMVGIETTARSPELSNWLYRMRNGKFDGGSISFESGNVPGLMLRNRLGTASANSEGGQNWNRIRDAAVDVMVDHVMAARTPEDFYAATRALDRILLWNFYYIPGLGAPGYRLVYWDKFGIPENRSRLQRAAWLDTWWWDESKAERVRAGMAELTSR